MLKIKKILAIIFFATIFSTNNIKTDEFEATSQNKIDFVFIKLNRLINENTIIDGDTLFIKHLIDTLNNNQSKANNFLKNCIDGEIILSTTMLIFFKDLFSYNLTNVKKIIFIINLFALGIISKEILSKYLKNQAEIKFILDIIKNWNEYKAYIPTQLHSIFDLLIEIYNAKDGKKIIEKNSSLIIFKLKTIIANLDKTQTIHIKYDSSPDKKEYLSDLITKFFNIQNLL